MEFLLSLDFVGPKPWFKVQGYKRYSSIAGVVLTFLILGTTIFFLRFNLSNWIYKKNPLVIDTLEPKFIQTTSMNSPQQKEILLGSKSTRIFFNFYEYDPDDMSVKIIDIKKLPMLNLNYYNPGLSNKLLSVYTEISLENCLGHDYIQESQETLQNSLCIPKNSSIGLKLFNDNKSINTFAGLQITSDTLLNVLSNLKSLIMIVHLEESILDTSQPENPFFRRFKEFTIPINSSTFNTYFFNIRQEVIQSYQTSLLFENKLQFSNSAVDKFELMYSINLNDENKAKKYPLVQILFQYSDLTLFRSIRYFGMEQVIAQLGGTFAVLIIIGQIISHFINCNGFEAETINSIFKFHRYEGEKDKISVGLSSVSSASKNSNLNQMNNNFKTLDELKFQDNILKDCLEEEDNTSKRKTISPKVKPSLKSPKKILYSHDKRKKSSVTNKFDDFMKKSDSIFVKDRSRNTEINIDTIRHKRSFYKSPENKKSLIYAGKRLMNFDLISNQQLVEDNNEIVEAINYLKNDIEKNKRQRINVYASSKDILIIKIKMLFNCKMSVKEKLFILSSDHINRTIDYTNVLKFCFDVNLLKQFLFESKFRPYVQLPSFNSERPESIFSLENFASRGTYRNLDWTNDSILDAIKNESKVKSRKFVKMLKLIGLSNK